MRIEKKLLSAGFGLALLVPAFAEAADVTLPSTLTWTAYNVSSTGYNQAVAIGKTLMDAYGATLRVVPGKNDISRLSPVRDGKIQFSAAGSGTFYAFEGVLDFANAGWGPQPVRLMISARSNACLSMGTAKDANIATPADMKGKRIGWVRGAPALQTNVSAMMAFGDLTWKDVVKVEMPGFAAAWRGLANGQIDAMTGFTVGGLAKAAEASPRGLHWLAFPHSDTAGWERVAAMAPHMLKTTATLGVAGISKDNPLECIAFPYPILIAYANQDADLTYNMTRAVSDQFPNFSGALPAAKGWATDRQTFTWVVPYHDGAIRFWKEKGQWTADMQAHNDRLIERQNVMLAAWKGMSGQDQDDFKARWMVARAAALTKAGFKPIWAK